MAHRYGVRPSDIIFDTRPDAFLRLSVDMAVASRAQAEEAARYEAARQRAEEERGEGDGHADRGKNRKPSARKREREKDKPLSKKVLTGAIGEAVDPALEREWIRLGGPPISVMARDTKKKEADFAAYIARRSATMHPLDAAQNGHGGPGAGNIGTPAEGQP